MKMAAELAESLAVGFVKLVEQRAASWVSEGLEDGVHSGG
jgi:hypothetical protein